MADQIYITECPRDAWQGIHTFIPTELKVEYLKKVWAMGFDTIDYTSFVSPKAIPQMADADQVTESLSLKPGANKEGKALAIVANIKGAERASQHKFIDQLGFPLSLSEQFQQRNTNRSIAEALLEVRQIAQIVKENKKELVVYLSMHLHWAWARLTTVAYTRSYEVEGSRVPYGAIRLTPT